MRFPANGTADSFLANHWQKKPLFLPNAIDGAPPLLEAEELAWLATLSDVESRLVLTERSASGTSYRVESGPFADDELSKLPGENWTLLVQDVEKHLPDFRAWLQQVPFLPDWRFDDLMISFAAPGGSVGPHTDNYDVFLCQGEGRREWRIASKEDTTPDDTGGDLSLLQPFDDADPKAASTGDVLYLPPGVAHWGVASERCMTYSIGMRAPTVNELRCGFERLFEDADNPFVESANATEHFYSDTDLQTGEASPGQISGAAVTRCRALTDSAITVSDQALAETLGCVVTDLKPWLDPECGELKDLRNISHGFVGVHGMARVAWYSSAEGAVVFVNGRHRLCQDDELALVRSLCQDRRAPIERLFEPRNRMLVVWLAESGAFDLSPATE